MYSPYFFNFSPINFYLPSFYTPSLSLYEIPTFSSMHFQSQQNPIIKQQNEHIEQEENQNLVKQEQPYSRQSSEKKSRFRYAKKNVESNVINQVISFISAKNKSKKLLLKILRTHEKTDAFYEILKSAKRQIHGYVGRSCLQAILDADQEHPIFIEHKKVKLKTQLRISEMRRALRKLTNHFLRNIIVPTLLTSSKLDKSTMKDHLIRSREIYAYVNNRSSPYGV